MKVSTITVAAAAAANVAVAVSHKHAHQHFHSHNKRASTATSWIAGPTAYEFVLDGQQISVEQVCSGIAAHELEWGSGASAPAGICSSSSAAPSTTPASTTASISGAGFWQQSSSSAPAAASTGSWNSWQGSSGSGVNTPFPDGQLDCSTFPSEYGAVPLDYLGQGGWSGIQSVTWGVNAITNIVTGVSGSTCTEGDMCSYACPPGYQKSQWPSTQGATGQSVGGLQCSGGKLTLTNPGLASTLCIEGMGGVQVTNNAGGVVAVCRTDYPGTESETIPVEVQPGSSQPLANPNAATYYSWEGGSTSAQYYLNPVGVAASQACQWDSAGSNEGNYAPINFGVGYKDGKTWLGLFQNSPTTYAQYQGTVTIQGDGLSDTCSYSNGQYCNSAGCNAQGCTVAVNSGTASYVVSS